MPKRLLFVLAWLGLFLGFLYWVDPGFWRGAEGHYEIALALRAEGEYAEGLEHLDRALRTEPDDPGLLRTRGYLALELGRAEEATADFHQALEAEPRDSEALLGLARAEAALGHPKRAHRALSELPARLETFEQRLERARLLVDAEDLSEAWSRYHLLAREKPNNAVVLEEASAVAAMVGHWDEVLSLAERLADITTEPKVRSRAVESAAEAAWASGRPELASELYERVSGPENLEARARLSFELERYSETAELHLELKALDPEARKIRTNLAYSLARAGRLEEAEAEYEWLLDEMPDDSELLVPYIEVLNRRSRYQRAWQILSSLPTPSTDIETHWLQAQTAHWAGESDVAARLLESWSERNPDDPRPYLFLAESRRRTGDRAGRADALKRYLNQEPDDVEVRMQLADFLADDERVFEAILHYREIVMLSPEDPDALTRLGVLFETTGDHQSALRRYEQAAAAASQPSTDLVTRLGRLHAWTGDAEGALPWYEELLSRSLDTEKRRVATLELAEALLASGRPSDALARVSSAAEDSSDEAAQLLAARAASGAGDRGGAVRYLDRLAKVRSLSFEEIRWLAGEQRGAGDPVRALETYEELLSRYSHDTELLLAVGDLRLDGHDPARAKEAYGRIPVEAGPLAAVSGLARANSALGNRPGAAALYREYLAERPNDHAVRLELAQVLMLAGQSGPAVEEYERYLSARGEDGIGLELTRAYLDQEDYEKAVSFALHAEARGEDVHQVRLARAQALGALGEIREADRILQSLADGPPPADDLTWAARLAEARNRPVGALFEAQAALEAGAEPAAELHLLQARALGSRGDVSRALASLRRARESGADTARVRQALDEFRLTLATELEIPLLFQTDDGGLRIPQGGITARFNVANRFRLGLSTNLGKIEQRGVTFDRWVMAITVDRWFLVPEIQFSAGLGWEDYGSDGELLVARGAVIGSFAAGAEVGLRLERSSLWSAHDEFQPRGFNRVTDAPLLGADFRVHTVTGHFVLRGTSEWETRIEAGMSVFEDGNRQLFAYAHRQIPLVSREGHWLAVRPNVYIDSFSDEVTGYASPSLSTSLGLSLHGVREWSGARLEAELNPNLLWVDNEWGPGGSGMLDLSIPVGRARVGGTLFGYLRGPEDYSLWRVMTRISLPVGGAGPR